MYVTRSESPYSKVVCSAGPPISCSSTHGLHNAHEHLLFVKTTLEQTRPTKSGMTSCLKRTKGVRERAGRR